MPTTRSRPCSFSRTAHEIARPAAEVEDPARATGPYCGHHGIGALLVEADRLLDRLLLGIVAGLGRIGVDGVVLHQSPQRLLGQPAVVAEIAPGDEVALGVAGEPVPTAAQQLVDLVGAHPVVLVVVQYGQQHEQLLEHRLQRGRRRQREVEVAAHAPLGELRIERDLLGDHGVSQRLEQAGGDIDPAAARGHREPDLESMASAGELRTLLAPSGHGRGEHLAEHHRRERRRDVRPVVHVLGEGEVVALRPRPAPDEAHRVDVNDQSRRAPLLAGLGEEHVSHAEPELGGVMAARVLVQEVAEIGGRLVVRRDGEEHRKFRLGGSRARAAQSRISTSRPVRLPLDRASTPGQTVAGGTQPLDPVVGY